MEQIIEKIQKLLALQEDAKKQGSLDEAETAAAMAQKLLLKYNLDMAKVNGHEQQEVILKQISAKNTGWNKRQGQWMASLYNGLCKYNFCHLVLSSGWDKEEIKLNIMGEPHNMEVVEYMGYTLSQILLRMEKQAWAKYSGPDKKGTFRRGYLQGATLGIISKLREQREREMQANEQVSALVLVQSEKVEKFKEQEFPNLTKGKASYTSSTAVGQGFADGRKVELNQGVGQAAAKAQIHG